MKAFVIVMSLVGGPSGEETRVAAVESPGPYHETMESCRSTLRTIQKRLPPNVKSPACIEVSKK